MSRLDEVLDIFFEVLKNSIESITLPTGENLVPTFVYSFFIFLVSSICTLLSGWSFIDWRGALIATILLLILAIIERRGVNEISRLYRVVKSGATTLKKRTARSGAPVKACGGTNPGDEMLEEGDGPAVGDGEV